MALDQTPNTGKHMRFRILRNIGNAFYRLGQFGDAVQSYETIMGGHPDCVTGFNLILCYFALGDAEKMRRGFQKLTAVPFLPQKDSVSASATPPLRESKLSPRSESSTPLMQPADASSGNYADGLCQELRKRSMEACSNILTAGRLIAPELRAPDDVMFGYKLIIDALRPDHERYVSFSYAEILVSTQACLANGDRTCTSIHATR